MCDGHCIRGRSADSLLNGVEPFGKKWACELKIVQDESSKMGGF